MRFAGSAPGGQQGRPRQARPPTLGFGLSQLRAAVEVAAGDRRVPLPADAAAAAAPSTQAEHDDAPPGFDSSSEQRMPQTSARSGVSQASVNRAAGASHATRDEPGINGGQRAPVRTNHASKARLPPPASGVADDGDAPPPGFGPAHMRPPLRTVPATQRPVTHHRDSFQAGVSSRAHAHKTRSTANQPHPERWSVGNISTPDPHDPSLPIRRHIERQTRARLASKAITASSAALMHVAMSAPV